MLPEIRRFGMSEKPFFTVYHFLLKKATRQVFFAPFCGIHIVQKIVTYGGFEKNYLQIVYFRVKYMQYDYCMTVPTVRPQRFGEIYGHIF